MAVGERAMTTFTLQELARRVKERAAASAHDHAASALCIVNTEFHTI